MEKIVTKTNTSILPNSVSVLFHYETSNCFFRPLNLQTSMMAISTSLFFKFFITYLPIYDYIFFILSNQQCRNVDIMSFGQITIK